jgi:hypothetical protein
MHKQATRSITFRINDTCLDDLNKLANAEGLPLNAYVNQILNAHVQWGCMASRAGFMPIQKTVVKDLFDALPDGEVKRIAIKNADAFQEILLLMRKDVSVDAIISLTKNAAKNSDFALKQFFDSPPVNSSYEPSSVADKDKEIIEYSEKKNKRETSLVIQHNMGKSWSNFLKAFNERLIIDKANCRAKISATDNAILVSFSET